jgi:uncharacterized protein YecE (DUF72 family)
MRRGRAYIGTSGWVYRSWRAHLYRGVPARDWLAHAARTFGALEINASHYVQIAEATYARWRDRTPADFRFALKAHRFVTHYKQLRDVDDAVARQRAPTRALGDKLAAVVWQLPARLALDLDRLDGFLRALARWPEVRHAFEARHRSWFVEPVAARLAAAGVAVCLSDAPDFPMWRELTTDLVYVRLHGHTRKYASSYRRDHLRRWAADVDRWTREGRDVHVYLDNDAEGAAVANALTLQAEVDALRAPDAPARRSRRRAAC